MTRLGRSGNQRLGEVDALVDAAADAAREFRALDQSRVDAIVLRYNSSLPSKFMPAFEDLSNRTNPRMLLDDEIATLLRLGYYGG
ncbi:hypothetical protein TUM20983_42470 [Mycobacterium antarcticum]|uniref:hypothetical protein n=1 Tax=Mycolicibacterium sp. TUM20983 TaxID=3023369 RepID=UPI0023980BAA|nr:hypothetical protein [Mycolicibacterium sp. TUM20983]GLP77137.1 hypothetical protein TUM20983_42470 [Mycolicibacterium sp. TUM20983]